VGFLNRKTDKVVKLAKEKAKLTKEKTIGTIEEMYRNGENITFYSVYKKADVSKSYVYSNPVIRGMIEKYRKNPIKKVQNKDSKDVIIETQKKEIKKLKLKIKELEESENYKEKYQQALKEIDQLKEQLKVAYKY